MKRNFSDDRAFTLIELLIVVAIIAILAAIAVPNFLEAQTRTKVTRIKAEMRTVATALEAYRVDCNDYPLNQHVHDNVMTMMGMSRMGFLPLSLTTPVAYLTETPLDFYNPKIMGDHKHTFVYINALNTDDANRKTHHALVLGMGMMGQVEPYRWALVSTGPDIKYGVMHMMTDPGPPPQFNLMFGEMMGASDRMGSPISYDPTNGTVSSGDIVRFAE